MMQPSAAGQGTATQRHGRRAGSVARGSGSGSGRPVGPQRTVAACSLGGRLGSCAALLPRQRAGGCALALQLKHLLARLAHYPLPEPMLGPHNIPAAGAGGRPCRQVSHKGRWAGERAPSSAKRTALASRQRPPVWPYSHLLDWHPPRLRQQQHNKRRHGNDLQGGVAEGKQAQRVGQRAAVAAAAWRRWQHSGRRQGTRSGMPGASPLVRQSSDGSPSLHKTQICPTPVRRAAAQRQRAARKPCSGGLPAGSAAVAAAAAAWHRLGEVVGRPQRPRMRSASSRGRVALRRLERRQRAS